MGTAYKTYRVTSPPDVRGIGRSKPFVRFEIFNFHNSFGCIFVLFCGNSKILTFFGEEVILKFKRKVFGKYIVILKVV